MKTSDPFDDLFDEISLRDWLREGDHAQGETPDIGTNHVAAQLLVKALRIDPKWARGFGAFGIGRHGRQAEPTGKVKSLVDVGFTRGDGTRVNLEVDPPRRIDEHAEDHRRAMQRAVEAARQQARAQSGRLGPAEQRRRELAAIQRTLDSARSVFVGADPQGRIRKVRHVHYELGKNGRVILAEDANIPIQQGVTPERAWALGILQSPPPRRRPSLALRQSRAALRSEGRGSLMRTSRFDDFIALDA
jgi:hypothetical protein